MRRTTARGPVGAARGLMLAALVVATLTASSAARADDVAAAESLFREARSLMKAGQYKKACPKLEESQRLDPGVGTLANLARCYEKTGRLASAWAKYREAADEATQRGEKKRARQAAKKADKLEPKLHRVAIIVGRSSRVDGLTITRNGSRVGEGSYGSKVPVDPGDVTVTASAPGYKTFTTTITLKPGRRTRVIEIPPLEKAPIEPPPGDDDDDDDDGKLTQPRFETVPGPPWYNDSLGWVLLGSGVAIAAGGGGTLVHANNVESSASDPGIGLEEYDRRLDLAEQYKLLGYGLVIVGGGIIVTGAIKLAISKPTLERRVEGAERRTSRGLESATLLAGPRAIGLRLRF